MNAERVKARKVVRCDSTKVIEWLFLECGLHSINMEEEICFYFFLSDSIISQTIHREVRKIKTKTGKREDSLQSKCY